MAISVWGIRGEDEHRQRGSHPGGKCCTRKRPQSREGFAFQSREMGTNGHGGLGDGPGSWVGISTERCRVREELSASASSTGF